MPKRTFEGVVGQFGDLAGHLDSGRAGTDNDEGEQLLAAVGVAGAFGLFEGSKDASAQLQRIVNGLHAGRPLGELIVAEIRLARARGDDQGVVRRAIGMAQKQ